MTIVRGVVVVFRRLVTEDEIPARRDTHFGLGHILVVHGACCSAEDTLLNVTQGSDEVRETHFVATLG